MMREERNVYGSIARRREDVIFIYPQKMSTAAKPVRLISCRDGNISRPLV